MQTHPTPPTGPTERSDPAEAVSPEAVLGLLSDDHAREISTAIVDEAKTAREIVADCDSSRTTVYRRLDRLQSAGLLTTGMRYDADGHHRTTYRLRVDTLSIRLDADGLHCTVEPTDD